MTVCAAAALSLMFTAVSHATSVPHATDYSSESPGGVYRFEADFEEILKGNMPPDAPVAYRLIDTRDGSIVWELRGIYGDRPSEIWPGCVRRVYVSDQGWVLAKASFQRIRYHCLAPDSGRVTHTFAPKYSAPIDDVTVWTWSWLGYIRFVEIDGESLFLMRFAWGERLLLDPRHAQIISTIDPEQLAAVKAIERSFVRETLNDACERLDEVVKQEMIDSEGPPNLGEKYSPHTLIKAENDIRTAMRMAGVSGYDEFVPLLRSIQAWRPSPLQETHLDPRWRSRLERLNVRLWREARLALRRMDATPLANHPAAFSFDGPGPYYNWTPAEFPERVIVTEASIDAIQVGMPLREVFMILGVPDAEEQSNHRMRRYEFDIDSESPFTLRVDSEKSLTGRDPPVVTSVQRITPPRWIIEEHRELQRAWRQ